MSDIFNIAVKVIIVIITLVILLFLLLYLNQEKLIFYPERLNKNYQFSFAEPFVEQYFKMEDGIELHGLFFKADSSKGVILYLHGNAGSVESWGSVASIYTQLHYNLLMIDYRGYGKSEGKISSEHQIHRDIQQIYERLKREYTEEEIIVLGYSIGTGFAARLASENHPEHLLLLAPYYNFPDLVKKIYPILPDFLLKYRLMTNDLLPKIGTPITIIHGLNDELIPYNSSERLFKLCKGKDKLLLLENQQHNGINENQEFQTQLRKVLAK